MTNTYKGFLGNELFSDNKVATAMSGLFYNGYTEMNIHNLKKGVEGRDLLVHENLQALINHKDDLKNGKRVNVHLEWQLTEDRMAYKNVKLLNVEVTDRED